MQAVVIVLIVLLFALAVWAMLTARRRGYRFGGDVVVRCREGHLYTTVWIPGVKLKAIDLGLVRFQYCPVGRHWSFVVPVRDSDLTDEERRMASQYHDMPVP